MIKTNSLIKHAGLFVASVFSLILFSACKEFVILGYLTNDNDRVFVYHEATAPLAANIVIVGDGFLEKDNQSGGKWDVKAHELADEFLAAPIIRDYKDHFNVFIYYADSTVEGTGPKKNTPFKPGGGNSGHPNRVVLDTRLKSNTDINTAIKVAQAKGIHPYNVMYINNLSSGQWEAGLYNGMEAWGYMNSDYQWVVHEFIGHHLSGLADEYAGASADTWGDINYGSNALGVNVTRHGFPLNFNIDVAKFPDVPNGPMDWADAIFGGEQKGDVFFEMANEIMVNGHNVGDYGNERLFFNNSKWETLSPTPEKKWLDASEVKSSTWPNADWQHWPPWVVFIGRKKYTNITWSGWARFAPWINGMGKNGNHGDHSFQADDACSMRQTTRHLCVMCRYRIWVEVEHRALGRGYGEFFMDTPGYGRKFPSKEGLEEFVLYDKPKYAP